MFAWKLEGEWHCLFSEGAIRPDFSVIFERIYRCQIGRMKKLLTIAIFSCSALCSFCQQKILVAAASDLRFALDSVIVQFNQKRPDRVEVTYGSSGKLSEQISNGAPFDLFFSADVSYPEKLKRLGKTASDIYNYGKGRIVVWSKKIDPTKQGMSSLLDPSIKKIAIANPLHAPYGKRAAESIEYYKLPVNDKLVYGENISQTAQFISTGAADIGIIALSLALSPNMKRENGKYFVVPENSHQPLVQGAVVTTRGGDKKLAVEFFAYIKSDSAKAVFEYFGFSKL
jgi:molybdate transport system substrate-binding protein